MNQYLKCDDFVDACCSGRDYENFTRSLMTTELRRAVRYPIVASVEIRQQQTRVRVRARTSDLSISGCYIDTLNPLPDGTDVELRIAHNDETVTLKGIVAYAKPNMGMGVQFKVVDDDQLRILQRWIAAVAPLSR